ncbi:hypothetical protein [Burkholderia sp. RS02]|uniref:hypothetical protein n=1 Tax=unclassified Burkholderia TaxID=2613784 RepID=UPI0032187AEB
MSIYRTFIPIDPNELQTVEELRAELARTIGVLSAQGETLARVDAAGYRMFKALWSILKAHAQGDATAVVAACEAYLNDRPQLRESLVGEQIITKDDSIRWVH